jgi:16S rRNA (cytosine1402-N4)-methyltransferase
MPYEHQSVLLEEAIEYLQLREGDVCIDGTIGGAGHAQKILEKISPHGLLIGFDLDPEAISVSQARLNKISKNFQLINNNFSELDKYGKQLALLSKVSGVLLDLGFSNFEVREGRRGFSFQRPDEPLDLRMNPKSSLTAAEILNIWPEERLFQILEEYGEEQQAKQIARQIIKNRKEKKFVTVNDLLQTIDQAYRGKRRPKKINIATKTWQALRIAVNDELNNIKKVLPIALKYLKPGGRLVVISFHSLEDRIVKQFFKQEAVECICPKEIPVCQCHHKPQIKIITKKPVIPSADEIKNNPQARSAKLRVAEKIQYV